MTMVRQISFEEKIQRFPGSSGWYFVAIPKEYTLDLNSQRKAWGRYPIKVQVGNSSWNTKLMMKKGGYFFIVLKQEIRIKKSYSWRYNLNFFSIRLKMI